MTAAMLAVAAEPETIDDALEAEAEAAGLTLGDWPFPRSVDGCLAYHVLRFRSGLPLDERRLWLHVIVAAGAAGAACLLRASARHALGL